MEEYSRYILSRLLKKSKITSILKAEGYLFSTYLHDIDPLMNQSSHFNETDDDFMPPHSVVITNHTLERWNERVGPKVNLDTLQKTLEVIFKNFIYRVSKLDHGIGSIDNEIIFTYEMKDGEFCITTFYGRKSLQPALNQMKNLRNYNLYRHDQVNLAISDEELKRQTMPLIPKEIIHFNGKKTSYVLEKYILLDRRKPCFLCYKKDLKKRDVTTFMIDLEKPEQILIPKNVLSVLSWIGFSPFVIDYFHYHHPEKVEKARSKAISFFNQTEKNDLSL